ncbi:MAG: hypothetical protein OXU20_40875 [Myxococcales bacterium]|nr:hypothetical protein [Myxococcales bacterium]MDD9966763.1 hypothetical protein [Myxococcales bacterium]
MKRYVVLVTLVCIALGLTFAMASAQDGGEGSTPLEELESLSLEELNKYLNERVDHYRCYEARQFQDTAPIQTWLRDQFVSDDPQVLEVTRICAPVIKIRTDTGEYEVVEPKHPRVHQVCYRLRPDTPANAVVRIRSQFGLRTLKVGRGEEICAPALKHHYPDGTDPAPEAK